MSKFTVAGVCVGVIIYILTLLIAPYYVLADQALYIKTYDELSNLNLVEGYNSYSETLGSSEFIHFLITWATSNLGWEKNHVMAVLNAFLAYLSIRLLAKWGASIFVAILIVLSNFYMLLMYFGVERLKVAFIFLVLSLLYIGQRKRFHVFVLLALSSHLQVLLIYGSIAFKQFIRGVAGFLKSFSFSLHKIVYVIILLASLSLVAGHVFAKLQYYANDAAQSKNIFDLMRITLLLGLSLLYSKNKYETVLLFIPIILAVFVVGSDRVNMMGYFVFLYYGLQDKRGLNVGVLLTIAYFSFKSYGFISDIIQYGDGFATMLGHV